MIRLLFVLALLALSLLIATGCDEDDRWAEASRQLVEADAKARTEVIGLQRDLQKGQAELGQNRDELENDRRDFANQRNRDPIVANTIATVGTILACLLPLVLCVYLVMGLRDDPQTDSTLTEILVEEIVADEPTLLPLQRPVAALPREAKQSDDEPAEARADRA